MLVAPVFSNKLCLVHLQISQNFQAQHALPPLTVTWTSARAFGALSKAISSMAEYADGPRHKFVVGIYNPDVPNPWDYALNHDFDFACTFISRPQLQSEILALPPTSPQLKQVLFKNALLSPSGKCSRYMIKLTRGPRPAYARDCFTVARDGF